MSASRSPTSRVNALLSKAEQKRLLRAMEFGPGGASAGPTRDAERHSTFAGIGFTPPAAVRQRAADGLELVAQGHRGGTDIGFGRAVQLAVADTIYPRDVRRMRDYFRRHAVDLRSARARRGEITPGVVAWLLWGGDEGKVWANETAAQMDDAEWRHNPDSARRTHPELWARIVRAVTAGARGGLPGQWSARKAQIAVALYKQKGGGYIGPKSADNALVRWTAQRWRTKSGRPSSETGERYLPEAAIEALSPQEYAATTRAKRAGLARGEQFTPQPERIAGKVRPLRQNAGARAIARELVRHCGWLKADARAITGKKWRKSMASPRHALSPDAQRVLLRALDSEVDPDVALVLRLCLVLGLRIAEATTVDRSRVTPEGLRVFGKGSKWRTVPWSVNRDARALASRLPAVATVSPGRAQRACTRMAAAHPELADLTPHVLRHTFATNALRCCMDPKALQAALGHDKFNTTLTYLHTLETP